MKFISLIIFFVLLHWTWGLVNSPREVNQSIHLSIQDNIKRIITDYVHTNLPTAKNLRFDRFWTENTKDGQIKASFAYSFEDTNETVGEARVSIGGYALLNRKQNEQDTQIWNLDQLSVENNQVEFKEGLEITPQSGDPAATPAPTENSGATKTAPDQNPAAETH